MMVPRSEESKDIKPRARKDPAKIVRRGCLIERMAAL